MVAEATGNLRMVVQQMWRILVLVLRLCGLKWQCVTKPPVVMAVVSAAGRTTMTMDRAVAAVDRMKLLSHMLPQQETKGEELTRKRRSDLHPLLLLLPRPRLRMLRNKKRNVKLQAGKKEDKLVEEIQKLRESLKQHPETPAKKPSGDSRLQLTPKGQSHLKTLCSFIHEGEPTQLIDVAAIHSWADVEEQLQAKTLPVLKEYLSTRCKPDDIPSRKAAAISKVVSLIRDALPS